MRLTDKERSAVTFDALLTVIVRLDVVSGIHDAGHFMALLQSAYEEERDKVARRFLLAVADYAWARGAGS